MIIELSVSKGVLKLETDNNLPHEKSSINFTGEISDRNILEAIEEQRGLHGHDGHNVTWDYITNVDLVAAVYSIPEIKVLSITPEIKPEPLPEGASA